MKKTFSIMAIATLAIAVYSCKKSSESTSLKTATLSLPATTESFFGQGGSFNDSLNRVATLGKVLFYDNHLSVNNAISCGSCHKQSLAFGDNVAFSTGYAGKLTGRNSIAITNIGFTGNLFWDGRESNINNLAIRPLTNHVEMGVSDPEYLPSKLAALPYYGKLFTDAYGDQSVTTTRITGAIGVFLSSITSNKSRFDQSAGGSNKTMFTAQELQGMSLFNTKYNCASCHIGGGGYYGGSAFKDIGLEKDYVDMGRGKLTGRAEDNGTFRVPNLHNVALTAPYMHDGRYKTLDDVLEHYSHNIENSANLDTLLKDKTTGQARAMNISDDEKKAIIAFLNTLTDYSTITDPKFSNPFKVN